MNKFKNIFYIVAMLFLVVVLSACGSTSKHHSKIKTKKKDIATTTTTSATASTFSYNTDLNLMPNQSFTDQWFSPSATWNTMVTQHSIDPNSKVLLHRALERVGVLEEPGNLPPKTDRIYHNSGLYINTVRWSDPVVQGGVPTQLHCRQVVCGPGNKIKSLAVPTNVSPNPLYDGWFTIISPNGQTAYDLWRARRISKDTISYQFMRVWRLNGPGAGATDTPSARGSGLPLFAGIIRPNEIQKGQINHALAISVPAPAARFYVPPASTTDGNGTTNSLPEGARLILKPGFRLKEKYFTKKEKRTASILLSTLSTYGVIVVGRAEVPTLYGQEGVTAKLFAGNILQGIKLTDFEVVKLPMEKQYPSTNTKETGSGGSDES